MIQMTWTIFWLPFFLALGISLFLLKKPKLAGHLATLGIFATFVMTVVLFFNASALEGHNALESSFRWMNLGPLVIEFGIYVNALTLLMLAVVTGVATLVFLFSSSYMEHEEGYARYYASLCLFVFSMLGIVLGNNLIQIFIFWELVGLSSYLLIGFYFQTEEAGMASKKAFLTTRVGDVGMMLGILALFGFFAKAGIPTFNFAVIEHHVHALNIPGGWMTFICLGIFLGAMGKSAQVPLHVWLPDAMAGPTPVSALIHAATMVAAGIFLLARVFFLFEDSATALHIIAWVGGITALVAATIALVQNDIKKILAYSTLSQLGYMVMALGLGKPEVGMFHLTTHAAFKALLFLGAGALIHSMHTQNIWEMGTRVSQQGQEKNKTPFYLFKVMPMTAGTFLIGTLALMGIPPLSGFFSKEAILLAASHGPKPLFIIAMTVVFLTAFYMGRLFTIVFLPAKRDRQKDHHIHEGDWRITTPLIILAIVSAIAGFFPIKEFISEHGHHGAHHGFDLLAASSLILAVGGFLTAFILYRARTKGVRQSFKVLQLPGQALDHKWFFDDVYDAFIKYVQGRIAYGFDVFERYVIVEWTVNGWARFVGRMGNTVRQLQTGVVQFYAFVFTLGVTAMIYFFIVVAKF
jgi:NADH-quinone oxidoreductase subunit L